MADRSVSVELRLKAAGYLAGLQAAKKATRDLGSEMVRATKENHANLQAVGRAGILAGSGIAIGLGFAISASTKFDKSLSGVKAVANATSGEMDRLRQAALDAGKATVFSASESADAEAELAKAGVSVQDILGGGLIGSLNLAAAGQIGVAEAANIAATAMVQFGKDGKDVPHIADLLAAAANKAQGGVDDMAQALKYVGPVAHQMGVSLEETVGTVAELANAGILGDQAGTSLRGMLTALTSPSKIAAGTMKELGISVYDASGQFVGFQGVAGQLSDKLGTLTNAERDQALGRIFGNEQITAARILYQGGAAGVDQWTKSVNDSNAAQRIASTNMDNLAGDLEQLRGSIETALIQTGSAGNASLRNLTQGATGAVNTFSDLPGPVQKVGFYMGALTSAALLTAGAVGTALPKLRETRDALLGMGKGGAAAAKGLGLVGKAGAVGAIAATAAIGLHALTVEVNKLTGNTPPKVDKLTNSLVHLKAGGKASGEAARLFGKDLANLNRDLGQTAQAGAKFNTGFGLLPNRLDNFRKDVDGLDQSLASLVNAGHADEASRIFGILSDRITKAGGDPGLLKDALDGYALALTNANTEQTLAAGSADHLAVGLDSVSPAAQSATDALKSYQDALNDTAAIDAYTATAELAKSFKELKGSLSGGDSASSTEIRIAELRLKAAREAAAKHGTTSSERATVLAAEQRLAELRAKGAGDKGVTNDDKIALGGYASQVKSAADAILTQTGSQQKANEAMRVGKKHFIELAIEAGYGARQAKRLADRLLEIPPRTDVNVDSTSIDDALAKTRKLVKLLHQNGVSLSTAQGTANKVNARGFASGGFIPGPPSRADTVPALLSTGEFVVNAASTAVNRGLLEAINSGRRFADGGIVRGGPTYSTSRANSITLQNTIVTRDPNQAGQSVSRQVQNDLWASGMLS